MKVRLKEIIEKPLVGEWGKDDVDNTGIMVLRTTNFTNEGIVDYSNVTTRYINKKNISNKFLRKGDILIEKSGGSDKQPVGRVVYFKGEENKYLFNNFTSVLRVHNNSKWMPEYIFYTLFTNYLNGGTKSFENRTTGLHNLKLDSYLDSIEVIERNLEEQKSIVKILNFINEIIRKRKYQIQKLDELVKSRFIEIFGNKKHLQVKIKNVCDFITKGTTPNSSDIYTEYAEGMIPYIKVYNLSFTGDLIFDEKQQFIKEDIHKNLLKRSKVYPKDVLMNIVGPPLGKFALVTNQYKEWNVNQAIAIFRSKSGILPEFLLYSLMQPAVLKPFLDQAVGIRQLNISLEQCRNIEIPLPDIDKQKEFVCFVEQITKSKLKIQKSLDKLEILKKSLMQEYFS